MDLRSFKPIVRADEKSGAQLASHPKRFGLHFSGNKTAETWIHPRNRKLGFKCMEFHDHMPILGELFGAEKRPSQ